MSEARFPRRRWVEREFELGLPSEVFPDVLERVRGTPARLEELLLPVPRPQLTQRVDGAWSMLENAGHLLDLEPLWDRRIDELLGGAETLEAADMSNRRTEEAEHNATPAGELLERFRGARQTIVDRLERLRAGDLERVALHPRLRQPLSLTDLTFFVAEHDDHHLARIREIQRRLEGGFE